MNLELLLESLLKFLGVIAPVVLGFYTFSMNRKDKKQKQEIESLKQEKIASKFNIGLLSNLMKLKLYGSLERTSRILFKRTKAVRVLVFVAINGKVEPKKVYALYGEKIVNVQVDEEYKGVEIDKPYVEMLHDLERKGQMLIDVMKMPKCMLKDIYFKEEITFSYLKFIKRYHLTEEDDAIVYMSIATDDDKGFDSIELTDIDIIVSSRIKPVMDKIAK